MSKTPVLSPVTTGYDANRVINQNFDRIKEQFRNTVSRDGSTPNEMNADLDMNSNDILNALSISTRKLILGDKDIFEAIPTLEEVAELAQEVRDALDILETVSYQKQVILPLVPDVDWYQIDVDYKLSQGILVELNGLTLVKDVDYTIEESGSVIGIRFTEAPGLTAVTERCVIRVSRAVVSDEIIERLEEAEQFLEEIEEQVHLAEDARLAAEVAQAAAEAARDEAEDIAVGIASSVEDTLEEMEDLRDETLLLKGQADGSASDAATSATSANNNRVLAQTAATGAGNARTAAELARNAAQAAQAAAELAKSQSEAIVGDVEDARDAAEAAALSATASEEDAELAAAAAAGNKTLVSLLLNTSSSLLPWRPTAASEAFGYSSGLLPENFVLAPNTDYGSDSDGTYLQRTVGVSATPSVYTRGVLPVDPNKAYRLTAIVKTSQTMNIALRGTWVSATGTASAQESFASRSVPANTLTTISEIVGPQSGGLVTAIYRNITGWTNNFSVRFGLITSSVSDPDANYKVYALKLEDMSQADYAARNSVPISHVGSRGTSHGLVTTTEAGFMSSVDKIKLDGIPEGGGGGDDTYVHPDSGITPGSYTKVTVNIQGHATAGSNPTTLAGYGITDAAALNHGHADATTGTAGFMTAADKTKLNGISAGATALLIGTTATTASAGNHTHSAVSTTVDGFMSAADKVKLNGIAVGATALLLGTTSTTAAAGNHTHDNATTSASGFMSNTDKAKLDGVAAGATNLTIGSTATTAAAGNHTHTAASTSAAGFMSAADKTRINRFGVSRQINGLDLSTGTEELENGVYSGGGWTNTPEGTKTSSQRCILIIDRDAYDGHQNRRETFFEMTTSSGGTNVWVRTKLYGGTGAWKRLMKAGEALAVDWLTSGDNTGFYSDGASPFAPPLRSTGRAVFGTARNHEMLTDRGAFSNSVIAIGTGDKTFTFCRDDGSALPEEGITNFAHWTIGGNVVAYIRGRNDLFMRGTVKSITKDSIVITVTSTGGSGSHGNSTVGGIYHPWRVSFYDTTKNGWTDYFLVGGKPVTEWDYLVDQARVASLSNFGIAVTGATRAAGAIGIGVAGIVNNDGTRPAEFGWAGYFDAIRTSATSGHTAGVEIQASNQVGPAPLKGVTPYNSWAGKSMINTLQVGAGSDASVFGRSYAIDTFIKVGNNGAAAHTGLVFRFDSLMREGVADNTSSPGNAGYAKAILLGNEQGISWWSRDASAPLAGDQAEVVRFYSEVQQQNHRSALVFMDEGLEYRERSAAAHGIFRAVWNANVTAGLQVTPQGGTSSRVVVEPYSTNAGASSHLMLRGLNGGLVMFGNYNPTPGTITGFVSIVDETGVTRKLAVLG